MRLYCVRPPQLVRQMSDKQCNIQGDRKNTSNILRYRGLSKVWSRVEVGMEGGE